MCFRYFWNTDLGAMLHRVLPWDEVECCVWNPEGFQDWALFFLTVQLVFMFFYRDPFQGKHIIKLVCLCF